MSISICRRYCFRGGAPSREIGKVVKTSGTNKSWTGLPQSQCSSPKNTNSQNSCDGVCSSLMSKNFSRRNVLKHNNKQKQNCQCSYINQLLQQYKIFKAQLNQKARTMQKQQNQIKNRMHWVFRFHHLKHGRKCTCCNQSKRLTHF